MNSRLNLECSDKITILRNDDILSIIHKMLDLRDGKDDRKWTTIREYLPLLSRKKFYSTVTHGYARGNEPVRYVDNILYYQQFLKLQTMTSTGNDNFSNQDSNSNKKWQDNIPPTI